MTEIMMRLKAETRTEHQATEGTALAVAMFRGTLSRAEYEAQLAGYLAMHLALEEAVARSPRLSAVVTGASKSARLRSDLRALGAALTREASPSTARAVDGFSTRVSSSGAPELLGTIYVFEGSALGAAILFPRLQASLGLADDALSYYRGDGAATMDRWRRFGERMNLALPDPGEQERALAAARATFVDIRALFESIRRSEGTNLRATAA